MEHGVVHVAEPSSAQSEAARVAHALAVLTGASMPGGNQLAALVLALAGAGGQAGHAAAGSAPLTTASSTAAASVPPALPPPAPLQLAPLQRAASGQAPALGPVLPPPAISLDSIALPPPLRTAPTAGMGAAQQPTAAGGGGLRAGLARALTTSCGMPAGCVVLPSGGPRLLALSHHVSLLTAHEMERLLGRSPELPVSVAVRVEVDGVLASDVYEGVQFKRTGGYYMTGLPHSVCQGKWHLGWRWLHPPGSPDAARRPLVVRMLATRPPPGVTAPSSITGIMQPPHSRPQPRPSLPHPAPAPAAQTERGQSSSLASMPPHAPASAGRGEGFMALPNASGGYTLLPRGGAGVGTGGGPLDPALAALVAVEGRYTRGGPGSLEYPHRRYLDSYKAVSFVRTPELRALFGADARSRLPLCADVRVEVDGQLGGEVHGGVVFKEAGANNSVYYMKGFKASLALQKLHCGFRRLNARTVVLMLRTPPPNDPLVAASLAAGRTPSSRRRRASDVEEGGAAPGRNSVQLGPKRARVVFDVTAGDTGHEWWGHDMGDWDQKPQGRTLPGVSLEVCDMGVTSATAAAGCDAQSDSMSQLASDSTTGNTAAARMMQPPPEHPALTAPDTVNPARVKCELGDSVGVAAMGASVEMDAAPVTAVDVPASPPSRRSLPPSSGGKPPGTPREGLSSLADAITLLEADDGGAAGMQGAATVSNTTALAVGSLRITAGWLQHGGPADGTYHGGQEMMQAAPRMLFTRQKPYLTAPGQTTLKALMPESISAVASERDAGHTGATTTAITKPPAPPPAVPNPWTTRARAAQSAMPITTERPQLSALPIPLLLTSSRHTITDLPPPSESHHELDASDMLDGEAVWPTEARAADQPAATGFNSNASLTQQDRSPQPVVEQQHQPLAASSSHTVPCGAEAAHEMDPPLHLPAVRLAHRAGEAVDPGDVRSGLEGVLAVLRAGGAPPELQLAAFTAYNGLVGDRLAGFLTTSYALLVHGYREAQPLLMAGALQGLGLPLDHLDPILQRAASAMSSRSNSRV